MKEGIEVYDIETLKSCFTYTGVDISNNKINQFVIHKDRNDIIQLLDHLNSLKGQVGFNNISFDYPIIHYILLNGLNWLYKDQLSAEQIIDLIYNKAQEIINNQNKEGYFSSIRDKDVIIPQLDLFRVWHYNNKARTTSLKALEISMNYPNVLDMPIDHSREDISFEEIDEILDYNLNDVLATIEFYNKSRGKIDLRLQIKSRYGINCRNYSDSKIGESLLLKLYCDKVKANEWDIKTLRSKRDRIDLKDVIFDYIKFNSKQFNDVLEFFKTIVVYDGVTKNLFKKSVIYKGFQYDYGVGGIHGCIKPGIYESTDTHIIIDADVALKWRN